MSSISRRRNGLMVLSVIGGLLSWVRSSAPRSQDRTPASATPRDPSLVTNYRRSGLVLRRIPVDNRARAMGLFSWLLNFVGYSGSCRPIVEHVYLETGQDGTTRRRSHEFRTARRQTPTRYERSRLRG